MEQGHKVARPILSREEYLKLRGSSEQMANLRLARSGNAEAKRRLVQMNYSCLPNDDGTLKGAKRMTRSVGMDVDFDPSSPDYDRLMKEAPQTILSHREELGLLMLERSVNKGFHIVFRRHPEMSQEDNLRWASKLLGIEYDRGAKDLTRVFFTTGAGEDDLLFLDDEIFNNTHPGPPEGREGSYTETHTGNQPDTQTDTQTDTNPNPPKGREGDYPGNQPNTHPNTHPNPPQGREGDYPERAQGLSDSESHTSAKRVASFPPFGRARVGASSHEKTHLITLLGGEPAHGSRNSFIYTLACYLRYVCDDNPEWIKQIIPTFGEDREKAFATVESACQRKQNPRMPSIVRRALKMAETETELSNATGNFGSENFGDTEREGSYFYRVQEMPRKLPALIKLLISKTPDIYRNAVAAAVFPSLAAHLCGVRFRYIDNVEHEATLMSILCAPTGSGKECITQPINRIMADIRRRDQEQRRREKEWKDECSSKGANKDKRERPEGLVIQEVNIDMTNPAFVLRMKEAEGHFLYTKVNELNLFDALKGKTNQHFRIMELAFDMGQYGQDRVGAQSVTETVQVRFNWNASCTPKKCRDYFQKVVTDGPVSRIAFSTIERRPCGSPIPVYGTYDAAFDEELKPYIDNLVKARGLVECRQLTRLAQTLVEENAEFARLSQNYVFENLSFRATVIAWLKACVLYVANGCRWEKQIEDFARWSLRYDLWCKLQLFGQMIYDADNDSSSMPRTAPKGPKNLLEMLPEEFTAADYIRVRQAEGFDCDNARTVNCALNQWVYRGYIVRIDTGDDDDNDNNNSKIFRKVNISNNKAAAKRK